MSASAIIFGCEGTTLLADERALFADVQPWGFILFARNLETDAQVKKLIADLRQTVSHDPHIFVDEEGGRVSRLRALGGWIGPPAMTFIQAKAKTPDIIAAIRANYCAIGARLAELGFTADCAPVLDVPTDTADPIIGDRAFCVQPEQVAPLAQACLDGLNDAGIAGVIKHIPGHGRADVDSHLSLPIVTTKHAELSATDFVPFQALSYAKMAMTAHVVYSDIDPDHAATTSRKVIKQIIRGEIGFAGLLMSDDLEMKALPGTLQQRAEQSLAAGCDILLHCSGDFAAMQELAKVVPTLCDFALERAKRAAPAGQSAKIGVDQAILAAQSARALLG
ncbi:MAG: beta-N-acetylhexosaminidase [Robiginitomaculum sp.]|nr:MAG: beta-N-acetylhexosaminidase [Robiginitomaculum sp.]